MNLNMSLEVNVDVRDIATTTGITNRNEEFDTTDQSKGISFTQLEVVDNASYTGTSSGSNGTSNAEEFDTADQSKGISFTQLEVLNNSSSTSTEETIANFLLQSPTDIPSSGVEKYTKYLAEKHRKRNSSTNIQRKPLAHSRKKRKKRKKKCGLNRIQKFDSRSTSIGTGSCGFKPVILNHTEDEFLSSEMNAASDSSENTEVVCVGDLDGYEEVSDIKKIGFYHKSNKSHKNPHVDIFVDVLWKNGDETREPLQNLEYSWYLVTFFVSRNRESLDSLLCENLKNWAKKVRTNFPNWDIRSSENSDCVIFALSASLHNVTYLEAVSALEKPISISSVKRFLESKSYILTRIPFMNCKECHIKTIHMITHNKEFCKNINIFLVVNQSHMFALIRLKYLRSFVIVDSILNEKYGNTFTEYSEERLLEIFKKCGRPKRVFSIKNKCL